MGGVETVYSLYNGVYDTPLYASFNSRISHYWERSLFQRLKQLFIFRGLPQAAPGQVQTDYDSFLYGLYRRGFLCVFKSRTYGVTFQPATPTGIGLQFQPTGMLVTTPYFSFDRPLDIGTECETIKITPDYSGIWDIVDKYADELKLNEISIRMAQLNARFAYAIAAYDDKSAQSVKAIMEQLENAEPSIVYNAKLRRHTLPDSDSQLPWEQFDRDLKKNFILPELLEARRTILSDFYREIGIPTIPDKKERYITSEVSTYNMETFTRYSVWESCLNESITRCNRLFGTNISIEPLSRRYSNDLPYPVIEPSN